jgi:heme-degrading monooxygenase HmoA
MFTTIISFPPIKEGMDIKFQRWFVSSNQAYSAFKGFKSRKLLRPIEGGNYVAVVEFENLDGFKTMHTSNIHDKESELVQPMFNGGPKPRFYEVIQG